MEGHTASFVNNDNNNNNNSSSSSSDSNRNHKKNNSSSSNSNGNGNGNGNGNSNSNVGQHYSSNATCLISTASFVLCAVRRVRDHHILLHTLPLLKKARVRQVV